MAQLILFKKNDELFLTREEAVQGLNQVEFKVGEPAVAIYGDSEDNAKMLMAVGIKEGTGEGCYSVISTNDDASELLKQITELRQALQEHEDVLAEGATHGHVLDSDDITFVGGKGTVVAAGKVKQTLSFTGFSTETFDGSSAVSVAIPEAGTVSPVGAGTAAVGTSQKWAREDHVHPAQENVTGNAGTATKLQSPATITLEGAVTGTVQTDFSSEATITTTLSDHTHEIDEINGLQDELDLKAPIADAHFTGEPTAPTADPGTNTVQIATTAFVIKEISDKLAAAMALTFKGTLGTDGTIQSLPASHTVGDVYVATTGAPSINGIAVEAGDMVICTKTGAAANDADWTVVQTNLDGAVTGPTSSVNNNIVVFSGASGKQVADSGVSISNLAKTDTTITAGEGLAGGGNLGANVEISHAEKPGTGNDAGGTGNVVTGVLIDKFGHVSSTTKATLGGSIQAQAGKYVSSVTLNGTTLEGTLADLPKVSVTGGEVEENQYVTGISVGADGYSLTATKAEIVVPDIEVTGGEDAPGSYVSSITSSGHTITVNKTALPEESGKVKVDAAGAADYLEGKIISGVANQDNNEYAVLVTKEGDQLKLTVKIDVIDGGTY